MSSLLTKSSAGMSEGFPSVKSCPVNQLILILSLNSTQDDVLPSSITKTFFFLDKLTELGSSGVQTFRYKQSSFIVELTDSLPVGWGHGGLKLSAGKTPWQKNEFKFLD